MVEVAVSGGMGLGRLRVGSWGENRGGIGMWVSGDGVKNIESRGWVGKVEMRLGEK